MDVVCWMLHCVFLSDSVLVFDPVASGDGYREQIWCRFRYRLRCSRFAAVFRWTIVKISVGRKLIVHVSWNQTHRCFQRGGKMSSFRVVISSGLLGENFIVKLLFFRYVLRATDEGINRYLLFFRSVSPHIIRASLLTEPLWQLSLRITIPHSIGKFGIQVVQFIIHNFSVIQYPRFILMIIFIIVLSGSCPPWPE